VRNERRVNPTLALGVGVVCVFSLLTAFVALAIVTVTGAFLAAGEDCGTGLGVTLPTGRSVLLAATVYSGSGPGAYGSGLAGHYSFAELGLWSETDTDRAHADRIGIALGVGAALAPYTRLQIEAPNGRTVIAEKRDVGMGGPPIEGHLRAIDLWTSTRVALGLPVDWSGLVRVSPAADGSLTTEAAAPALAADPAAAAGARECEESVAPASQSGERIVEVARSQLGVRARPPGSNCTVYGPCEPWCALFTTWVWRTADIGVPSLGFSGAIYSWARAHSRVYPPTVIPRPGWAALFGSGPENPSSSLHVAIVESVLPDDEITLINGNFDEAVMRTGPCHPADAQLPGQGGCEEPAPIYAYAAPD